MNVENLEGIAHSDSRHSEDVTGQLEEIIVTIFHALAGKYLYLFAGNISCPGWKYIFGGNMPLVKTFIVHNIILQT